LGTNTFSARRAALLLMRFKDYGRELRKPVDQNTLSEDETSGPSQIGARSSLVVARAASLLDRRTSHIASYI
jgi:hypothetical protein